MAGPVECSGVVTTDAPADETVALMSRSGLVESPPEDLAALCSLAVEVLGHSDAGAELHLVGADGPVARAGVTDGASFVDVPLTVEGRTDIGFLRVHSSRAGATSAVATVARAMATVCELELARTRLFDADEQVARAAEQLTEGAGQLVHDLNNPLAAAAMSLEIAREQVEDGLVAQLLDRAVNSTARMKRMTANLLSFTHRPVAGTADVGEVLSALLEEFEGLAAGAVSVEGDLPEVAMSPPDLEVVWVALLENAVKFADEDRDLKVTVRAEQVGDRWRVIVADNGRGVEADDLSRIFEPTVRLDRRVPGMGLGLSTVRRLVRSAGGEVGAASRPGVGTEVWFELPV